MSINFKMTALILLFSLILFGCSGTDKKKTDNVLPEEYYTDMFDWNSHHGLDDTILGRGINLGNFLEAPRGGSDDGEGAWTGGRKLEREDITRIADAGFAHIRIPCRWTDYMSATRPYDLIDVNGYSRLNRVKEIIGWAMADGLKVVINTHHYNEMFYLEGSLSLADHKDRLDALWNRLSKEFPLADYPSDKLIFEFLNEPHENIGYDDWNGMIESLTEVIWQDNAVYQTDGDKKRVIMIGTANWGGVPGLYKLELPDTITPQNTIITVHYYEPFHFTHQGAEWSEGADAWIGTRWLGTESDRKPLIDLFTDIEKWNTKGFEIYVGEFGVYSKYADKNDQKAWTAFICRESERRKYSWAYWEYAAGFGAYDPLNNSWRSWLKDALIPKK
ncbi:MAG: glycoside hydrolase family 5 protein [Spirochaetes bacterium]|jgi:endoglucanase|nr:glycoside hydrolase family 5 protein [Spirochaetota bacterium]